VRILTSFEGTEDAVLTIDGDGTFSVEPEKDYQRYADMVGWMGENPKPTSIYEFIKSGLYFQEVFRIDEKEGLTVLGEDD
jgi:hypothetical protein